MFGFRLPRRSARTLDLAPDNVKAYNNLGAAYLRLKRLDDAAEMFERSATLDPNANSFSSLGTAHYEQGHYGEATRAFERP